VHNNEDLTVAVSDNLLSFAEQTALLDVKSGTIFIEIFLTHFLKLFMAGFRKASLASIF
jgi:hypothetical protein